jgi:cell division protein FtsW (lipid II flippase)
MSVDTEDRRSLFLLLSLLLLILLSPFLGTHQFGEFMLLIALFVTLISIILELHRKGAQRWLALIVAVPVIVIELVGIFHPSRALLILDYASVVSQRFASCLP